MRQTRVDPIRRAYCNHRAELISAERRSSRARVAERVGGPWHTYCLGVTTYDTKRRLSNHGCLLTRTRAPLARRTSPGRGRARRRRCIVVGRASRLGGTRRARQRRAQRLLISHSCRGFTPQPDWIAAGTPGQFGPPCPLSFLPAGFFLGERRVRRSIDRNDFNLSARLQFSPRFPHRLYCAQLADHLLDHVSFEL